MNTHCAFTWAALCSGSYRLRVLVENSGYDLDNLGDACMLRVLFERLRSNPVMAKCEFVVLSANAAHVQNLPGVDARVFEVVGKERDLNAIVTATIEALQRQRSKAS